MRYFLRESLLEIIIKGSFNEIFIRHRLYLPTKWKMFLVPLLAVFVFEKIKNKLSRMVFFSHGNAPYRNGDAIIVNICI